MENRNEKHNFKLSHILSLLAIVVLVICLVIVVFAKVGKDKSAQIAQSIENKDTEGLMEQLDEVHSYLETLESAVNESTLTLDTLCKDNENDPEVITMVDSLKEIQEKLNNTKSEVSTLREKVQSDGEYDISVMTENFLSVFEQVENLKKDMGDTLNSIAGLQGDNQKELISEVKRIENSITKSNSDSSNGIISQLKDTNKELLGRIDTMEKKLSDDMEKNRLQTAADLEQVFQYVASGKTDLASALATVGCNPFKDGEGPQILSFSEISYLISHSQDINGTYIAGDNEEHGLSGAVSDDLPIGVAAWVKGNYIVGSGKGVENAYNKGFNEGYQGGYNEGHGDGYIEGIQEIHNANIAYVYHVHTTSDQTVRPADYHSPEADGCFTVPVYKTVAYTVYNPGCSCSCGSVHWEGNGWGQNGMYECTDQWLVCDECGHRDHRGSSCGTGRGNRTEYRQEIDYYACGCNKTDYATAQEGASVESATIYFNGMPIDIPPVVESAGMTQTIRSQIREEIAVNTENQAPEETTESMENQTPEETAESTEDQALEGNAQNTENQSSKESEGNTENQAPEETTESMENQTSEENR